ncbi:MAG: hypothetical protein IJJ43_03470 [Oscillospiraceae bacterium]|nr:hypothetical protein [Oscillospiraceae bacterium]
MKDLRQLGRELEQGGRGEAFRALADSAEGKKLGAMVDAREAERALQSGDAAAMQAILGRVLATDEGRRLAENLRKLLEK